MKKTSLLVLITPCPVQPPTSMCFLAASKIAELKDGKSIEWLNRSIATSANATTTLELAASAGALT